MKALKVPFFQIITRPSGLIQEYFFVFPIQAYFKHLNPRAGSFKSISHYLLNHALNFSLLRTMAIFVIF